MFDNLMTEVREFVKERDWEQFHSPKNLAAAISVEAAELLENFLWDSPSFAELQHGDKRKAVEHELADIIIYCLEYYALLQSDPEQCIMEKVALNKQKYPVEKAKGKSLKYNQLD
jgi:NTP pyrophosphatase (non-canonical NTP hydrolase)